MSEILDPYYVVAVIAAGLAATLGLGIAIGLRLKSGTDFFLGGRRLPWWAIGMSLVATDIGGTDIIGVGGAAYSFGLSVANFEWIGCVPAMIVAAFGYLPPVEGALLQEAIDVAVILNALRALRG